LKFGALRFLLKRKQISLVAVSITIYYLTPARFYAIVCLDVELIVMHSFNLVAEYIWLKKKAALICETIKVRKYTINLDHSIVFQQLRSNPSKYRN
jgi:hypothetical protein